MRKKIAVFVNGYGMDTLNAALKGIKSVDICKDFDFFLFISYASYDDFEDFNKGELKIYDLPVIEDFDGAIVFTNALNSVDAGVKQVKRVWDNVPYYRKKMEEKGVTPDDIKSVDDLHKLPFLSKKDLRDAYPT